MTDLLLCPFVENALREDLRSGDITTDALIPADLHGVAALNFRAPGIVCGLNLARIAFATLDASAQIKILAQEGRKVSAGTTVMRVEATGRALLSAERVALNFAQRLSGIATLTSQFVEAVAGTGAVIADTRKTTPGLRLLEKYAVRCGGASNHRFALDDLILIKDNHIALCGGISQAVERARQRIGHAVKIEVECDTLAQVEQAVAARADIILLDNMGPEVLKKAVEIIGGRARAEASGGVNLQTVRAIAQSGVDLISVGALTHGAKSLDIGLDVEIQAGGGRREDGRGKPNLPPPASLLPPMIGQPILRLETTDSTNRVALDWDEAPHGAVVVARAQSGGRGRLGRRWESPRDAGLYLSLVLRPESPRNSAVLSLLAALSAARALEKLTRLKIGLKWPNDVLCIDSNGAPRKIGGILGEVRGSKIVVGIGINLNQSAEELPERPIFPASSLRLQSGRDWDVEAVLAAVLEELDEVVGRSWEDVRADYERRCWGIGEVARFESGGASSLGIVEGVDGDGALLLRTADGLKRIVAGEVSYFL